MDYEPEEVGLRLWKVNGGACTSSIWAPTEYRAREAHALAVGCHVGNTQAFPARFEVRAA